MVLLLLNGINNMTVYVVYHYMDRDGGVSAIFDTERKALDFVIKQYYDAPYFSNMTSTWLDNKACEYVVEMIVK